MADFVLDQSDYFDDEWWETYGNDPCPNPGKQCRCCGEGGLFWKKLDGKWRLFDDSGLHKCKINPLRMELRKK